MLSCLTVLDNVMVLATNFCGGTLVLKSRSIPRPAKQLHETTNTWLKVDFHRNMPYNILCAELPVLAGFLRDSKLIMNVFAVSQTAVAMYFPERSLRSRGQITHCRTLYSREGYIPAVRLYSITLLRRRKTVCSGIILLSSCQVEDLYGRLHVTNADIRKNKG